MKPPKSILDPKFVYVNAASTDVGKRIRAEIARLKKMRSDDQPNVTPIKRSAK